MHSISCRAQIPRIFAWIMPALFVLAYSSGPAVGQQLALDPFVQESLRAENFEPGGAFFPNGDMTVRGSVIPETRSGQISIVETSSQLLGRNILIKSGTVHGSHSFTIDLSAHHPYSVHSPFDERQTIARTVSEESESRTVELTLGVQATLVHPGNGYDPPSGGGFPSPSAYGAIDLYTLDVTGTAQGQYILSSQDTQKLDVSPFLKQQAAWVSVVSQGEQAEYVLADRGSSSTDQQCRADTLRLLANNPNPYEAAKQRGDVIDVLQLTNKGAQLLAATDISSYGASLTVPLRSSTFRGAASTLKTAGSVLGLALQLYETSNDIQAINNAPTEEARADATNQAVRNLVTYAGGIIGGAIGGSAAVTAWAASALASCGITIPAAALVPVAAVGGSIAGSYIAGFIYDNVADMFKHPTITGSTTWVYADPSSGNSTSTSPPASTPTVWGITGSTTWVQ